MRKTSLILISLFISIAAKAQFFSSKAFVEGYYYDNSGQKIPGMVNADMIAMGHILFRPNLNSKPENLSIANVSAVVMIHSPVYDSLAVLTEDNKEKHKYFAHFICATPTTSFYYKYTFYRNGGTPTLTTSSYGGHYATTMSHTNTHYGVNQTHMYKDGNTTYELTKRNYIEVLSKAFADVPDLVLKIQNKELKFDQMGEIFGEYKQKSTYKPN